MKTESPIEVWLGLANALAADYGHMFSTADHLLEASLQDLGVDPPRRLVARQLESRRRTPIEPAEVRPASSLKKFLSGIPDEPLSAEALLGELLGESSPVETELREDLQRIMARRLADSRAAVPHEGRKTAEGPPDFLRPWREPEESRLAVDRPALVDQVLRTLLYGNTMVVGAKGSGRRTLLNLCARRLRSGPLPAGLAGMEIHVLDPIALMAGTTYRGELEERVQSMLVRLRQAEKPPVVLVDDVGSLVGSGKADGSGDIASALLGDLRNGSFRLVGCVGEETYRDRIDNSGEFGAGFRLLRMPELDAGEAEAMLSPWVGSWEETDRLIPESGLVAESVALARQYVPQLALPGSARKILEEAKAAHAYECDLLEVQPERRETRYWNKVESGRKAGQPVSRNLGRRHLLNALEELHRIPFEYLDSGVESRISDLDEAFHGHIFGQNHVFDVLQKKIMVSLLGMSEPRHPRGRLFFLGPPGTGKSETARLLARYLMGSEDALLRFNMSEYSSESGVSSLIGADKGLVNASEGGRLTEPLRMNPRRVLLFDEIEKAHPKIFDLFLAILDDGVCQDKRNLPVSFRHSICIFTSNAGGDAASGEYPTAESAIIENLAQVFRREFLDRIDAFVTFGGLGRAAREKVAAFQLERCRGQFRSVQDLQLDWTPAVVDGISEPIPGRPGVRDISRWVQSEVKPAVCRLLLESGSDRPARVVLDRNGFGDLVLNREAVAG